MLTWEERHGDNVGNAQVWCVLSGMRETEIFTGKVSSLESHDIRGKTGRVVQDRKMRQIKSSVWMH